MYYACVRLKAVFIILLILLFLASCSSSDKKAVYENVVEEKPLVVPPDISMPTQNSALVIPEIAPQSMTYKIYTQKKNSDNAELFTGHTTGIRVVRDGAIRWLEFDAKPKDIWNKSIEFFEKIGFQIKVKKPKLGIIETNWVENRSNIPTNWFSKALSKLYSTGQLDKYRVRLERNNADTKTLMFLTHQGAIEKVAEDGDTVWVPRNSEAELEFEMLQQFLVYLGNDEADIKEVLKDKKFEKRTKLVAVDGQVTLLTVKELFPRTWRRTGLAIDRLGFTVEDRNRSAGIYYIKVSEKYIESQKQDDGFFSKLFSDEKHDEINQFIISLEDKKDETHVQVLTRQGDTNKSPLQKLILEKLDQLLK